MRKTHNHLLPELDACEIAEAVKSSHAFAKYFFSHHCRYAFSKLHLESFARYDAAVATDMFKREGTRTAIAAPRGAAKSTIHSFFLPIIDICLQRERYIILVSATLQQAAQRLQTIKGELLTNEKLRAAFPALIERDIWQKRSILVAGVQIDAFGALSEMRGISSRGIRPTKIIMDDVESSLRIQRKPYREQAMAWYDEVIENLGDNFTNIEIVGTLLHPESLLARLLERPGFAAKLYRSIIAESTETEMWKEYLQKYKDHGNPDAPQHAHSFYLENKTAMDAGAEVLWPEKESYERLVQLRARIGDGAFDKEKQNAPTDESSRIFYTNAWAYFVVDEAAGAVRVLPHAEGWQHKETYRLDEMSFYGYLDSAVANKKSEGKGDYAAIVVVGCVEQLYFVVDAVVDRIGANSQVAHVYELNDKYHFTRFSYESNCFQTLVGSSIERYGQERKVKNLSWRLPLKAVNNTLSKRKRIESLESRIGSSAILFNKYLPKILFDQADEFPSGKHDDALDALAGAVESAWNSNEKRIYEAVKRDPHSEPYRQKFKGRQPFKGRVRTIPHKQHR